MKLLILLAYFNHGKNKKNKLFNEKFLISTISSSSRIGKLLEDQYFEDGSLRNYLKNLIDIIIDE